MAPSKVFRALLVSAAVPAALAAQTSITVPPGCCGNYIYPWGTAYIFGQTFKAPSDPNTVLKDLNLSVFSLNGGSLFYRWYVFAWDGTGTTGSALFQSGLQSAGGSPYWTPISTNVGVNLTANQTYVFFLQGVSGTGEYGQSAGDFNNPYADGTFVYSADGGATWANIGEPYDLAFTADFTATPEPVSMLLIATGLAGVGAVRRRRRTGASSES